MIKLFKVYGFPEPYNLDMIEIDGVDFIIHFKSSNWTNYNDSYLYNKKEALKRLLNKYGK